MREDKFVETYVQAISCNGANLSNMQVILFIQGKKELQMEKWPKYIRKQIIEIDV